MLTSKQLHGALGGIAFLLILTFFTSTLVAEIWGDYQVIAAVKRGIFFGVWALIPLMALTGYSGAKMAPNASKGPIGRKKRRMPVIALNGLLILIPAAITLNHLAGQDDFGPLFFWIQGAELIAGGINLSLMTLNIRDGLAIARRRNK